MSHSCRDCLAFEALKRECRRKSPVMVPVPQKDALGQVAGVAAMGMYPATSAEGWCCEYAAIGVPHGEVTMMVAP